VNELLNLLLFIIPLAAIALMFLPWSKVRETVAIIATVLVLATLAVFKAGSLITKNGIWTQINQYDRLSFVTLAIVAVVGLTAVLYATGYLKLSGEKYDLTNRRHLRFFALMMIFYALLLWAPMVHNLIILWALIEGTALASVFLIDFENTHKTFEATWKYIVMMEIGGAVSLTGTLIILFGSPNRGQDLTWNTLMTTVKNIPSMDVKLGFALIVVGYGLKAGLVPMHTWLPDAHSMAPSPISAMLSGIKINVALYGILRFYNILSVSGEHSFALFLLRATGLLTILVAVAMTSVQKDFKRLFAYSSVENMGLIILGYTLGPLGMYGALLQMLNHAIIKPGLFYLSGNLIINYKTTEIKKVSGALFSMKWSGLMLALLMLAIAGAPPFGLFISEFIIILSALRAGLVWIGVALVALLVILFANFLRYALQMVFGHPSIQDSDGNTGSWRTILPPFLHLAGSLVMGTVIPVFLQQFLYLGK
jgi:hydrogenase-4 component F